MPDVVCYIFREYCLEKGVGYTFKRNNIAKQFYPPLLVAVQKQEFGAFPRAPYVLEGRQEVTIISPFVAMLENLQSVCIPLKK